MFYLIGAGLKAEHLTIEALSVLKKCGEVFFEKYTSDFPEQSIEAIEALIGKPLKELDRAQVEEEFTKILSRARNKDIALLVIGNPLFGTTHVQLLLDAGEAGIESKAIPGISIQDYLGRTGLNGYKFGRVVSIVMPSKKYKPESFYDSILSNLESGLHSLCLLDIKPLRKMTPMEALKLLLEIEVKRKKAEIKNAKIVVLAGLGSEEEKIVSGKAGKLIWMDFPMPASIIVCAELSEKEEEALEELTERVE